MTPTRIGRLAALLLCLPLTGALAQPDAGTNVVERGYNPDDRATMGLPD